tara:strand:+ start:399 stop:680 length:282 start_codon:yes stop_codon:yes gene_type:complete
MFIFFTLYFLHLNDAKVDVDLIYKSFFAIPVSIVILVSIGSGIAIGYVLTFFSILATKSKIRKIENKNLALIEELDNLRNIAIDEDVSQKNIH